MKIDEITQTSLLYDIYGQLLTKRQREVMELYHEENLSLSEIAEEFSISRQGVHDTLKNAEKSLREYEEKLEAVSKFQKSKDAVRRIDSMIDGLLKRLETGGGTEDMDIAGQLKEIKGIIDKLED